MDDPSHRAPPPPYPPGYPPHYPGPSGSPPQYPVQHSAHVVPGVSVHISNIVHGPQYPQPYPPAYPQYQQPQQPGVVDMMRADASHRAMDAVARRGPARVLSYVIGAGASAMLGFLVLTLFLGASVLAVAAASVPLAAVAVAAFAFGARAGRGVASHHLEQAILDVASRNSGEVKVVTLAQATGRPLRECQTAIDAMVSSGHATIEADEAGVLIYRVPELSPTKVLVAHVYEKTRSEERR